MTDQHLSYWTVRTTNWTFSNSKIRAWVEDKLDGRTLNACAGVCQLSHDAEIVRNDIQQEVTLETARTINGTEYEAGATVSTSTDVNWPVGELREVFLDESFDTIVFDPPFSPNQAETTYGLDHTPGTAETPIHETLDRLLKPGGQLIVFGFSSTLMPDAYGYGMEDFAVWNQFGGQFDWFSSVLRKPTDPSSCDIATADAPTPGEPLFSAAADVLPNGNAARFEGVTGARGGNDGHPITLSYLRYPAGTDLQTKAYRHINERLVGRTLTLSHTCPKFSHDPPVVMNGLRHDTAADAYVDPQRLSDEFAHEQFGTVVVDPPPEAFQKQLDYYGQKRVEANILKYEAHALLESAGRIIQLGHMATCMTSALPYHRRHVTILSAADAPRDFIITIDTQHPTVPGDQWSVDSVRDLISLSHDREADTCPVCDSTLLGDGSCLQCGADVGTRHVCSTCGEGSYHHPVWYVDCLECGAAPDNYCVDPETGAILQDPHEARIEWCREKHATCGQDSPIRSPPVDHIDTGESGTAQTSLTGY